MSKKQISSALISVYDKTGLAPIINQLHKEGVTFYSTGGTEKFIRDLKNALLRIENKSYGICRVTGNLIKKERLKLVPHATLSIKAKNQQY